MRKYIPQVIWAVLVVGTMIPNQEVWAAAHKGGSKASFKFTVEGQGRAVARPDMASISFSVIAEGKDPAQVQRNCDEKMNQALTLCTHI